MNIKDIRDCKSISIHLHFKKLHSPFPKDTGKFNTILSAMDIIENKGEKRLFLHRNSTADFLVSFKLLLSAKTLTFTTKFQSIYIKRYLFMRLSLNVLLKTMNCHCNCFQDIFSISEISYINILIVLLKL